MRGLSRVVLIFSLVLFVVATTAVADSMRCGSYVVSDGDSQSRVLDLCGEPRRAWQDGFIEQVVRSNEGYYDPSATPKPYSHLPGYETETRRLIPVYKWEYNLGRGTFLKTLVFQGDTLAQIIDGPRQ